MPVDRLESEPSRRTREGVERASHVDGRYSDEDADPGAKRQHAETTRSNRSSVWSSKPSLTSTASSPQRTT